MDPDSKTRLAWIELYQRTKDTGLVSRRCGISRPTLRNWLRRYQAHGLAGLQSHSRRPKTSPMKKVPEQQATWILHLRQRRLGTQRIQTEFARLHHCHLSRATILKVLQRHHLPPLKASRLPRKKRHRYEREVSGECIQMDTCQVAPDLYQYTAIDDCTRIHVLGLDPRRMAANSLLSLEKINEEMPFPVQCIQTDCGREFFAYKFQERLMSYAIKFRPIKPRRSCLKSDDGNASNLLRGR